MPTIFDLPTKKSDEQADLPIQNPQEIKASPSAQSKKSNYPTPPGIEMSEIFPGVVKPITEETIFEWQSPSRAFKKRKKQYYTTVATIVLLLSLILVFSGQILTVAVVLSVAFMAYVMMSVPPQEITHKITTYGIRIENKLYYWEEMGRFWFEKKYDQIILKVEIARFPNQLSIVIKTKEEKMVIKQFMSEVLLNQKPEPTLADKVGDWLQKKFPLEIENS